MAKPKLGVWFEGLLWDPQEEQMMPKAFAWLVDTSKVFQICILVENANKPLKREFAAGQIYLAGMPRDALDIDRITLPEQHKDALFSGPFQDDAIQFPKSIPDCHAVLGPHFFGYAAGEDYPDARDLARWSVWYK